VKLAAAENQMNFIFTNPDKTTIMIIFRKTCMSMMGTGILIPMSILQKK
jgi:hypothetical protein